MSKRNWKILFQDVLDSIDKIEQYTQSMEYEDFVSNSMVIDAVVRNIEIIGEASRRVPHDVQDRHSKIPWKKIAGIRNRIVHEYFGVDISIIWFIVTNELTPLRRELETILNEPQE